MTDVYEILKEQAENLWVIGTVGLFNPMAVDKRLMWFEFPAMLLLCALLFVFCRTGFVIKRWEGLAFVLSFCAFIGLSYWLA